MQSSYFNDNVNGIVANRADGYKILENGMFEIFMTNLSWVGEGGVYTSLEDFIKWDQNFYDNDIGERNPEFIELLETPHPFFDGADRPYAWGMVVLEYRSQTLIVHGGSWVGFRSFYSRYPGLNLSFIAMCNVDNSIVDNHCAAGV